MYVLMYGCIIAVMCDAVMNNTTAHVSDSPELDVVSPVLIHWKPCAMVWCFW